MSRCITDANMLTYDLVFSGSKSTLESGDTDVLDTDTVWSVQKGRVFDHLKKAKKKQTS